MFLLDQALAQEDTAASTAASALLEAAGAGVGAGTAGLATATGAVATGAAAAGAVPGRAPPLASALNRVRIRLSLGATAVLPASSCSALLYDWLASLAYTSPRFSWAVA